MSRHEPLGWEHPDFEPEASKGSEIISFAARDPFAENAEDGIPLNGRTLEQLIDEIDQTGNEVPFRLRSFEIVREKKVIFGQEIDLVGGPITRSGYVYPDGTVFSKEEFSEFSDGTKNEKLRDNVLNFPTEHVVRTKTGGYYPFENNRDRIISLRKLRQNRKAS